MFYSLIKLKNLFSISPALAAGLLLFVQCGNAGAHPAYSLNSLDTGFRQMYSLDFSAAHKTFAAWQELHPDDPLGAASNAAAYLFSEFDRLHILDLDLFTSNRKLEEVNKLSPDPNIKMAFENELAKADGIAAKILAQSPDDRNALFA